MSMDTFSVALSGLNADTDELNSISNNLSNLNTIGYKSTDLSFADVFDGEAGMGVTVEGSQTDWSEGSIETTNNPLDVAIQGQGFLVVQGGDGQQYTRDGELQLDQNNNLVTQSGMNVQGYVMNPSTGQIDPSLGLQNIQIPSTLAGPTLTSQFQTVMNLDATSTQGTQFSTPVQIYDSLGNAITATLTLEKGATSGTPPTTTWNYDITVPGSDVAGGGSTPISLLTGKAAATTPDAGGLVFDSNGNLTSAYIGSAPSTLPALANLTIPPSGVTLPAMADGGTLSPSITWNLLGSNNAPTITGFDSTSAVTSSTQNGSATGSLSSMSIQSNGTISADYTNGQTLSVAQIALAQFPDLQGLQAQTGGLYNATITSGAANIGAPGQGGAGTLVGGSLEQSNVDLATELTNVITFQRAYEANAKIISTTDQIMQDTLNLKMA